MADPTDPTQTNTQAPQQQDQTSTLALTALQNLVVAINNLTQTVTNAPT